MPWARLWRTAAVSGLFLAAATVGTVFVALPDSSSTDSLDRESLLEHRARADWGPLATRASEMYGAEGLEVLELFGDEAAYCLQRDPRAFEDLVQVARLDPSRFRLATGPWRRAVLDWAQNGKLGAFRDRLRSLPPDRLRVAEGTPAALPLLCMDGMPTAHAMLEKYGPRVLSLFTAVNFAAHPEDLERIARAVEREGDSILDLNENYGLAYALLLVPPDTEKGSRDLPELVKYALRTLPDQPVALTLMLTNYDTVRELLDGGERLEQLTAAIDLFKALPPVAQQVSLDHRRTLRLLTETWHEQRLGAVVLRRCGPEAADLIYDHYASDEEGKWPALVALAKLGEPALAVLRRYRDYGKFHALLRRSESELMGPRDNPPAVAHAVHNIYRMGRDGQQQIDAYLEVTNLKGQVLKDARGPLPEEAYLEWVPGYIAWRTGVNFAEGYHVTGGEVFWATVDGISTATLVYGVVASGVKTVGLKIGQKTAMVVTEEGVIQAERVAAKEVVRSAEQKLAQSAENLALRAVSGESAQLQERFGAEVGKVASKRLEARTQGLALELLDRRQQYVQMAQAGDIHGKARLVEEIGEDGAREYAAKVGYRPLYEGEPGKGMGLDQVYRDGSRVKVIEAKGGGSPLKPYRGHQQGSLEYTKEVADWAVASPSTSDREKRAAREVLQALKEGRLDVEVVRTSHVQGRPGVTRVEQVVGTGGVPSQTLDDEVRLARLRGPGMADAWVRATRSTAVALDVRGWLKQGEAVARRTGIALWTEGSGPLGDRTVVRAGAKTVIPVRTLLARRRDAVDDFAVALMERSM